MDQQLAIIRRHGGPRADKRDAWQQIIGRWKDSGLGATDFCRRHDLPLKRFFKWRARLQTPLSDPAARFLEVAAAIQMHDRIEIHHGAARVLLPMSTSLADVLHALKEAAC